MEKILEKRTNTNNRTTKLYKEINEHIKTQNNKEDINQKHVPKIEDKDENKFNKKNLYIITPIEEHNISNPTPVYN